MALTELSEVSARIKELRGRTDLTQYEVAYRLKVPPRTYQSWENGEVETSRANYTKLGKLFGASANWILFGQEDEPPLATAPTEDAAAQRHVEVMLELGKIRTLLEAQGKTKQRASRKRASG